MQHRAFAAEAPHRCFFVKDRTGRSDLSWFITWFITIYHFVIFCLFFWRYFMIFHISANAFSEKSFLAIPSVSFRSCFWSIPRRRRRPKRRVKTVVLKRSGPGSGRARLGEASPCDLENQLFCPFGRLNLGVLPRIRTYSIESSFCWALLGR